MEKQSTSTRKYRCFRLLTTFSKKIVFIFVCMYSLVGLLQGEESKYFVDISEKTSLKRTFVLEIPQITPSRIEAGEFTLLDGVKIVEYSKTAEIIERSHGTRLTLVLQFSKPGVWNLEKIPITIDKKSIEYVQVPEVVIVQDFSKIEPEAYFELVQDSIQGQKISVELWVKNCATITAIQNDLSKNSLFEVTKRVQPLPYSPSLHSTESILIAEYSYIPLEEGTLTIPTVKIAVTSFTNKKMTIETELKKIRVSASLSSLPKASIATEDESVVIRDSAPMQEVPKDKAFVQDVAASVEAKIRLLDLLCKIICSLGVICITFIIITFFMHRKQKMGVLVLAFVSLISVCFLGSFVSKRRAVCYQLELQTIPENNASIRGIIEDGEVVVIKSETANWYLVQLSDKRSGWIPCNKCINVK